MPWSQVIDKLASSAPSCPHTCLVGLTESLYLPVPHGHLGKASEALPERVQLANTWRS